MKCLPAGILHYNGGERQSVCDYIIKSLYVLSTLKRNKASKGESNSNLPILDGLVRRGISEMVTFGESLK